ncbi:MAG: FtsX-like permease family protein [Deltaproteobacteria bacterium]|nr:MAG: FtsX-like permease family protein [Deltaproteobacteria bacterium]
MIVETAIQSLEEIREHKLRTLLTVLSITLGITSVVLMTSLAQSALTTVAKGFEEIGGARLILLMPARAERPTYHHGLTLADKEALAARVPHLAAILMQYQMKEAVRARGGKSLADVDVLAAEASFGRFYGIPIAEGRNLRREDLEEKRRVCVLGAEVAQQLYPTGAVGKEVVIWGDRFRVVGVFARTYQPGPIGFDWNRFLLLPLHEGKLHGSARELVLNLRTTATRYNGIVQRITEQILQKRHRNANDFQFLDFSEIMRQFYRIFLLLEVLVGGIAAVAVGIGGIGVMNIMLAGVEERLREIGIRKAVGASDLHIALQFLTEAVILTLSGGLVGCLAGALLGFLGSWVIHLFFPPWVIVVSWEAMGVALVTTAIVGIVFGFHPARRAARLEVVACLHPHAG